MFRCAVILIQKNDSKGSSSKGTDGELRTEKSVESCEDLFGFFFGCRSSFGPDSPCIHIFFSLVFFLAPDKVSEHYLAPLRSLIYGTFDQPPMSFLADFRPLGIKYQGVCHQKYLKSAELCAKCLTVKVLVKVCSCFMKMEG